MVMDASGFVGCVAHRLSDSGVSDSEQLRGSLAALRRLGNHDPLVAFHVDDELSDAEKATLLHDPRIAPVRIVDAARVADGPTRHALNGSSVRFFRSYYCTIFALLHSPFVRTTVLSPDTLFLADPALWWRHEPRLLATGTLFFHDLLSAESDRWFTRQPCNVLERISRDLPPPLRGKLHPGWQDSAMHARFRGNGYAAFCTRQTFHNLESSLILLDASKPGGQATLSGLRALLPLIVVSAEVRGLSHGDTEFFWMACEISGGPCAFSASLPALLHRSTRSNAGRLSNHHRGCHAHLTPHGQESTEGGADSARGLAISHVNLDSFCGWETAEPPDAIRRPLAMHDGETRHTISRNLTVIEARRLTRYREDLLRHSHAVLLPWRAPCTRERSLSGQLHQVAGCVDACSDGGQPSAACAAQLASRVAFCREAMQRQDASRLMRANSLFHPNDAAFCITAAWRHGASAAQRPNHENGGILTLLPPRASMVSKSLLSCLVACGWGGGEAAWAKQRAQEGAHAHHEHERNTVISRLAGFEGRTVASLQARTDQQLVAICKKAQMRGAACDAR